MAKFGIIQYSEFSITVRWPKVLLLRDAKLLRAHMLPSFKQDAV